MPDNQILKLELTMSPRAIDELKNLCGIPGISKYELPDHLFPEEQAFEIKACGDDAGQVLLGFDISGKKIVMCGSLIQSNFFCVSVYSGEVDGKAFSLYFYQERREEVFRMTDEAKKRVDMWYGYIEALRKKSDQSSYRFFCRGAEVRNNCIDISVYDLKSSDIKGLTVGTLDNNGTPLWGFGSAERLHDGILTVRPFGNNVIDIMKELSNGIKLIAFDGAADITCKRMKQGLDKLCAGYAVNKRLAEFIFDPMQANRAPGDNIILNEDDLLSDSLNPEQLRAVEAALNAEDLYLIQGPPGTGKTTVIAELCYQNSKRGLSTLIVSQSNLAVDNAISRVMRDPGIRVLRKGDSSRVEEEGLPFIEDNVVATWTAEIASASNKMDNEICEKLSQLKSARERMPEILSQAENVIALREEKLSKESQLYFYQNVYEEIKNSRTQFFEYIDKAYELDDIGYAYQARECYPQDMRIPMDIYNDLESIYLDIKADVELMHRYTDELAFIDEYTARFCEQFEYIKSSISMDIIEDIAFEGIFYYADREMITALYEEGERILDSEPSGIRRLIFGRKWRKAAVIYLHRAENLVASMQQKSIRYCERIWILENDKQFNDNVDAFHLGLDALCEEYQNEYFAVRAKCEDLFKQSEDASKDYGFSAQLFSENLKEDDFYGKALKNIDVHDISLERIEYNVNKYYQLRCERYNKWRALLESWRKSIGVGGKEYDSLKKLYIENANVIGITCIQSGTKDFNDDYPSFDVVIIDEASKSTLPDMILPMLKGKKIILVGDHKQLPPFIDSTAYDELDETDGNLRELIKVSPFEELYENSDSSYRTMLFRQYRMHRDIAALINQFYMDTDAGRLESPLGGKPHNCEGYDISEEDHVLWYDIPNTEINYEKKSGKSFCNEYEVKCIKDILAVLQKNLSANGMKKSVGIITFYDAQVRLLENHLIDSGFSSDLANISLRIGSVDRFQGMEEDIIIVSFVRNNKEHSIGFARDSRRINVAMSRARQLLIITACSENFIGCSDNKASKMFSELYKVTGRLGGIRKAADIPNVVLDKVSAKTEQDKIVHKKDVYMKREDMPDTVSESPDEEFNILDRFILRAAFDFKGQVLTVKNLSNALGIAPVFVESSIEHLKQKKLLNYRAGSVRICVDGENIVNFLLNSDKM